MYVIYLGVKEKSGEYTMQQFFHSSALVFLM
jgi:hypothetical protein